MDRIRIILLILFVVFALLVRAEQITSLESQALLFIHIRSTDSIDRYMLAVNAIGGPKPVLIFTIIFSIFAFQKNRNFDALAVPLCVGISGALNIGLRAALHRHRPELWHTLIYDHSFVWSFPSGHACLASSFATAINLALWNTTFRRITLGISLTYCLIVAVTSVTLGVHYPLDVLGGWLSGFLVVSTMWSICGKRYPTKKLV